jgi:hypothetical protein
MTAGSWMGLGLALAVSAPAAAWASDKDEAKALVREGLAEFGQRDYQGAHEAFVRAYALDPAPSTLLNLALSELNTDRPVEAAAHFRAYLARGTEPAAKLEAVRSKWLPRAEEKLARLSVVAPAGAQVQVDGQPVTQDPSLGVYIVVAGEHDVTVTAQGRAEKAHLTAPVGSIVTMRALVDEPPSPSPSPAPSSFLPPEPSPEADRGPSTAKIVTVAGLGVAAAAGLGIGIGFGAAGQSKSSDIATGEGCISSMPASVPCQHVHFDVSIEHQYAWASIGGYVGAGVFAAAGVATWLLWPKAPVRVSAAASRSAIGLLVAGALP